MTKKSKALGPGFSSGETLCGIVYLMVQMLVLPSALSWINLQLGQPMKDPELNFLFYLINFIAACVIFHDFWGDALRHAIRRPVEICQAVILGLAAYYAGMSCVDFFVAFLSPGHANHNNDAMFALQRSSPFLTMVGTLILTPPVEEVLHRGVIFRSLYARNKVLAYIVSTGIFAFIHIMAYLGRYSPLNLFLAVLQYVPAGLALGWSYAKSDSIVTPILIHAAVNAITLGLIF